VIGHHELPSPTSGHWLASIKTGDEFFGSLGRHEHSHVSSIRSGPSRPRPTRSRHLMMDLSARNGRAAWPQKWEEPGRPRTKLNRTNWPTEKRTERNERANRRLEEWRHDWWGLARGPWWVITHRAVKSLVCGLAAFRIVRRESDGTLLSCALGEQFRDAPPARVSRAAEALRPSLPL